MTYNFRRNGQCLLNICSWKNSFCMYPDFSYIKDVCPSSISHMPLNRPGYIVPNMGQVSSSTQYRPKSIKALYQSNFFKDLYLLCGLQRWEHNGPWSHWTDLGICDSSEETGLKTSIQNYSIIYLNKYNIFSKKSCIGHGDLGFADISWS